jgi:exodeoxyribonuclease V beta subunit
MTPFDLLHTPLRGTNLIEAAAGTGKTYAIEGLFLRLVLEKELPVEQILVVTFTRAATAELRDRIYRRLARARDILAGGSREDEDLRQQLAGCASVPLAKLGRLLGQALMDFDRAAIFTIHGFCQRVLYENAFETGSAFDAELIQDQTPILVEVVEDFWRQQVSGQPPEFLQFCKTSLGSPDRLMELARKATAADFAITPRRDEPCLRAESLAAYRRQLDRLRECWRQGRDEAGRILRKAPLNGRTYGTLAQPEDGDGISGRERTLRDLFDALDAYLAEPHPQYPPPAAVSRLSAAGLARVTLRRQPAPSHPVFDACDALQRADETLAAEMSSQLIYIKSLLVSRTLAELERRKSEKGRLSFDDLLRRVDRALGSSRGNALVRAVRGRYLAALVDEFQDTDDRQYAVFERLFSAPPHLLFMIGDPKQAIYGFRGADIFSYLRAAKNAESRYSLVHNWRSSAGLVRAVNALFSRCAAPFLFADIGFIPGTAANETPAGSEPAMVIWHLEAQRYRADGKPLAATEAQSLLAGSVTAEIQQLIADQRLNTPAAAIAVLVRTNRQAELMKARLSAAGVPAVIYSNANVFDTPEAHELSIVLASIAEPQNAFKLKSAEATHLLDVPAADIAAEERSGDAMERRIRRHWEYFRLWTERGFISMFRQFMSGEGVQRRLLQLPDGERRVTNLLHLAELAHRTASDEALGAAGLLKWLGRQLDPGAQRAEENQLRLESDEQAVRIVTVHRSKGLEYPVVFCPFAWSGSASNAGDVFFHNPDSDFRLTADFGSDRDSVNRVWAQNEILAENLRMLYVAVTRARQRCYLAWGRINTAETSALAYLLRRGSEPEGRVETADWISRLKAEYRALGEDEVRGRLDDLAGASEGAIAIRGLPDSAPTRMPVERPQVRELACREFRGRIDTTWSLTSYSGLAAAAGVDFPDHDSGYPMELDEFRQPEGRPAEEGGLSDFPAGARAGTFFHSIFETLDFTRPEPRAAVDRRLKEFGFDASWAEPVCRMIDDALSVAMFADPSPVRLADVSAARRVSEMEFYFPLNLVTPALLEEIFARHGSTAAVPGGNAGAKIERLHFAPTRGCMKGFIDLVFEHRGRYYLIDWKSNRLGRRAEDYHPDRLKRVMAAHRYDLQYHLYTLAVHQHLRRCVPGYDYARHFGGVCYVFLRGVSRLRDPDVGLFRDRPEPGLVHALGAALIPGYG